MSIQERPNQPKDSLPSPPPAANADNTFSLTDLLQPTMTLEQIKIIELALQKIKSKRDALLSKDQGAGNTVPSYDWSLMAKQMAKALTTTCQKAMQNKATTIKASTTAATISTAKPPTPTSATMPANTSTFLTPPASPPATPIVKPTSDQQQLLQQQHEQHASYPADDDKIKPIASEPTTEMRDGVEWVSFVYSHLRIVRRYCIRTDLDTIDTETMDEQFKKENCVYPRAHLPREQYQGNRWAYETECNRLGWKLAFLNKDEIAGKRGLIQRAVDSYRNRYPSMRSRRVARQEKLRKGTLRKRRPLSEEELAAQDQVAHKIPKLYPCQDKSSKPKTLTVEDHQGHKHRIRINIETVDLPAIDLHFKRANCVYPRAMHISSCDNNSTLTKRNLDEALCNEVAWKLAWLNSKQLANKRVLLQRVLDVYRSKFMPDMPTRPASRSSLQRPTPLTMEALAAHEQQHEQLDPFGFPKKKPVDDDNDSIYTGTTDSLDFHDCFSPPADDDHASMLDLPCNSSATMLDTSNMMLIQPLPTTTSAGANVSEETAAEVAVAVVDDAQLPLPLPPMMADDCFESVLDAMASSPRQSLSCTLTTASDLMDDHLSISTCGANSPPHRYTHVHAHEDAFVDPLLMHHDDPHAPFALPSAAKDFDDLLPTGILAQQDMDWIAQGDECLLATDSQAELVHQLFTA